MNAITGSNDQALAVTAPHERGRAASAPAYRYAVRLLGRLMFHYLKSWTVRDLKSVPEYYRRDFGVPWHAIDEVATALAARRAGAWVRRRLARKSEQVAA